MNTRIRRIGRVLVAACALVGLGAIAPGANAAVMQPHVGDFCTNNGATLYGGQSWWAGNGVHLDQQYDGNLVLYHNSTALWNTGTYWPWDSVYAYSVIQPDGNFVEYGNGVEWASNTNGFPHAWLCVQSDGNLVIYNSSFSGWIWKTGTHI